MDLITQLARHRLERQKTLAEAWIMRLDYLLMGLQLIVAVLIGAYVADALKTSPAYDRYQCELGALD